MIFTYLAIYPSNFWYSLDSYLPGWFRPHRHMIFLLKELQYLKWRRSIRSTYFSTIIYRPIFYDLCQKFWHFLGNYFGKVIRVAHSYFVKPSSPPDNSLHTMEPLFQYSTPHCLKSPLTLFWFEEFTPHAPFYTRKVIVMISFLVKEFLATTLLIGRG